MKKYLIAILSAALIYSCGGEKKEVQKSENPIKKIAAEVQKEFIPDRRVDAFDIKIEEKGGKTILKGATTNAKAREQLINRAKAAGINFIDSLVLLPEADLGEKRYGVVTLSVASMRTHGDYAAEMATQALLGTPVKILQKGSWLRVQTPDGYISYTYSGNIKRMTATEYKDWATSPKVIFTDNYGFALSAPNATSEIVSDLVAGDILRLDKSYTNYYKVFFPDGREAYVNKWQAKEFDAWISSVELTPENIVAKAKTYMGVPYLWGGTSAKAFDCSGFAKTVYFMHGILLLRDASQQVYTGQNIDISGGYDNLQPGDLMFFGKPAEGDKKERIGHVAIYIGNKEFIHEATQVHISSLDPAAPNYDEYNTNRFIRASRIIGNVGTTGIWEIKNNPAYSADSDFWK